jgi:hypothetical protein
MADGAAVAVEEEELVKSPRGRVEFRARGGLARAVLGASKGSLAAISLLRDACVDLDCAIECGMRGGHHVLLRISMESGEVSEVASEVAALCAATLSNAHASLTFPLASSPLFHGERGLGTLPEAPGSVGGLRDELASLPPLPFAFPFSDVPLSPDGVCEWVLESGRAWGARAEGSAWDMSGVQRAGIWVRPLQSRMRSQEDVGVLLWPAAQVMGRWLLAYRAELLQGRRVLELGAGLGLSGFAAACAAHSCVLTDFHRGVLANLHRNAALNVASVPTDSRAALSDPSRVGICALDWDLLTDEELPPPPMSEDAATPSSSFVPGAVSSSLPHLPVDVPVLRPGAYSADLVIGSDMVCRDSDCIGVVRCLRHFLAPGPASLGVFFLAPSESRWGVAKFQDSLEAAGFQVHRSTVPSWAVVAAGTEWAMAGGYEHRIQIFLVRRPERA